jgi:hypothetical protein
MKVRRRGPPVPRGANVPIDPLYGSALEVSRRRGQTWRVIVALLLIATLVVDRFVLLPAFEDGQGSAGVALLAWLGVNLLPAMAWLALNVRDPKRTRGQLAAGSLAVAATTAVLLIPVLISWTAR